MANKPLNNLFSDIFRRILSQLNSNRFMYLCLMSWVEGRMLPVNQAHRHWCYFDVTIFLFVNRKGHAELHITFLLSVSSFIIFLVTVIGSEQTDFFNVSEHQKHCHLILASALILMFITSHFTFSHFCSLHTVLYFVRDYTKRFTLEMLLKYRADIGDYFLRTGFTLKFKLFFWPI